MADIPAVRGYRYGRPSATTADDISNNLREIADYMETLGADTSMVLRLRAQAFAVQYDMAALFERLTAKEKAALRHRERIEQIKAAHQRDIATLLTSFVAADLNKLLSDQLQSFDRLYRRPCVYILWGESETQPVYIGQSVSVLNRLGAHMRDERKRKLTKRIQVIECDNERAMGLMEMTLIKEYQPLLNKAGL